MAQVMSFVELVHRKPRVTRFLGADGFCLDVAIDHGFFDEHSFLTGIEDMRKVISTIVAAQVCELLQLLCSERSIDALVLHPVAARRGAAESRSSTSPASHPWPQARPCVAHRCGECVCLERSLCSHRYYAIATIGF